MALDLERQQAKLIEQIAAKATASSARELAGLVIEATCDSRLIAFPKLLALPVFYKLVDTEYASSLDLLRLFAYGTWGDYEDNSKTFPALGHAQIAKLKQLTMLTLAQSRKTLTYDQLKNLLDFSNVEDLEHFLESCNNSGILTGKLNKQERYFQVLYTVDAYEKSRGKLLLDKSFDIFLEEAKKDETGSKPGQLCNGIVMQVHIPSEVSCCKSELRSRMSRLFIMLLKHVTNAHAKGLSFDGHIYTAMFIVVGEQLLLLPEASAKAQLTCDNFVKDRKSVASILRRYTGLEMHYFDEHGVEKNILYPMYMMDLMNHLEGAISNLHPDHASSPLTMASDEGYILFLLCHPTFLSDAARSVLFWYVRTYEKSIKEDDKMAFKSAMEQIFIKVKWFDLKDHRLFKNVFGYADSVNNSYEDDPVNCFRLIRDWELHLPTYLTEKEREIYTAAVINYLIEHYFDDFLPQTMYHLLCTYSKKDTKFDLKDWIQRLQQVTMEEANFLMMDWDKVGVHGLLPTDVITQQAIGTMAIELEKLRHNPIDGPCNSGSLAKWRALNILRQKNETIYYQVLAENIEEYEPIVYTPTVGIVCQKSSGMIQSSWGLYLSADDQGYMFSVMNKSLANQVDVIVVTDGSRVLGFDDLGVKGIGVAIAKLDLYVAAAGINPQRVLPVMIDVGTNNEKLLKDPVYHGMQTHRLDDEEFHVVVDKFVSAIFSRWPKVIIQFEGFEYKRAFRLLDRYRTTNRVFNDDIQGTAGVALAGLLGAVRAQGKNIVDFPSQKIVVAGADSSWIGVVNAASQMMARILGNCEGSIEIARCQFWIVDADGLMTEERTSIAPDAHPFARRKSEVDHQGPHEGATLFQVVKRVKPDMLLGLSGVGGLFSKEVLEALKDSSSSRPAVFVMSSSIENVECKPDEAFAVLGEKIIFASGSPFCDVDLGNGKIGHSNHAKNIYLFPGIGLGTLLSGARIVSDGMLQAAAERLALYMTEEEVLHGIIYPPVSRIREITKEVATAVVREAFREEQADGYRYMSAHELSRLSQEETTDYVKNNMWRPAYPT